MKTIILDTDFLINIAKNNIHVFDELKRICNFQYEIKIIDKTLDELKGKPKEKLIISLLESKNVKIIKTKKDKIVDELILGLKQKDLIIATQDKDLKNRVKSPIITIRQGKYLQLKD